jgi:hypothetical protein
MKLKELLAKIVPEYTPFFVRLADTRDGDRNPINDGPGTLLLTAPSEIS